MLPDQKDVSEFTDTVSGRNEETRLGAPTKRSTLWRPWGGSAGETAYLLEAAQLRHGAFLFGAGQFQQLIFPAVSLSW